MAPSSMSEQANPEVQAQCLMNQILNGNLNKLTEFLNQQVEPGLLQHILNQLKENGNRAYQHGELDSMDSCIV